MDELLLLLVYHEELIILTKIFWNWQYPKEKRIVKRRAYYENLMMISLISDYPLFESTDNEIIQILFKKIDKKEGLFILPMRENILIKRSE